MGEKRRVISEKRQEIHYKNVYEAYVRKATALLLKHNDHNDNDKEVYKGELAEWICQEVDKKKEDICSRCRKYLEALKAAYVSAGKHVVTCDITSTSRVIVDVSSPFAWLIDEVGLAWDPLLDSPIISGIKGVVRAAAEWTDDAKIVEVLFGKAEKEEAQLSLLSFTEAYPVESKGKLVVRDVITPIYSLERGTVKEHEAEPTPVNFIAINKGVKFRFLVILNSDYEKLTSDVKSLLGENYPQNVVSKLEKYVKKAVEELGVGGKTSSGYGSFTLTSIKLEGGVKA
ncbi:MAG: type III-B CRISPR module RAMP protein Cmr6 [Candidatus Jordarchaeales archaeon]